MSSIWYIVHHPTYPIDSVHNPIYIVYISPWHLLTFTFNNMASTWVNKESKVSNNELWYAAFKGTIEWDVWIVSNGAKHEPFQGMWGISIEARSWTVSLYWSNPKVCELRRSVLFGGFWPVATCNSAWASFWNSSLVIVWSCWSAASRSTLLVRANGMEDRPERTDPSPIVYEGSTLPMGKYPARPQRLAPRRICIGWLFIDSRLSFADETIFLSPDVCDGPNPPAASGFETWNKC